MGWHVARMKDMRNAHKILGEEREGKRPLWKTYAQMGG
jgi:hypothetical protein